jgi:uncharacterized iron-regulated membrane protein
MLRTLLVIHRYLAVAVGPLMALWCLSGFVMMYQPYPQLTEAEQLQGLEPLQFTGCCRTGFLPEDGEDAGSFRIEMQYGEPVLRQRGVAPFDLATGMPQHRPSREDLLHLAAGHANRRGIAARPQWLGEVEIDQWTIQTARRNQPVQHVAVGDAAGMELYLNGNTGEVFQDTSRRERVLNWLGAIPHWLYLTALRRHGPVWSQIVIWTSVLGTFLAATGLYVGIARLQRRGGGSLTSPFRGWWYWHHIAGLFFGVLALTWVFSGLLTMQPWGLLQGSDIGARVGPHLSGSPPVSELRRFLQAAPSMLKGGEFVRLRSQPFDGRLYVLAERADGTTARLNADAVATPLSEIELRRALADVDTGVDAVELMRGEDSYYYAHKSGLELPVWRVMLADAQRTRLYVSPTTGEFAIIDRDARNMRWFERGLHGLDFTGLRQRPAWDIIVILLLAGVTAVCITGSWMAIQRVRRDLGRLQP